MKSFFVPVVLLCANLPMSAAEPGPAPSNLPNAEYPRIGSDLSVTFRLKAADARQVKLEGGAGLVQEPIAMTRGDDGVWTTTTPPAVPGFHYYWFNVDGLRVNDAASHSYFGYGRETSGIDIPEVGVDFYAVKNVPHGEVRAHWYFSKITGKWRRAFVYTPPPAPTTNGRPGAEACTTSRRGCFRIRRPRADGSHRSIGRIAGRAHSKAS